MQTRRVGDFVGPFLLEANLSDDGQGSVYHAIHLQQRRSVALKLLPPTEVADEAAAAEFGRELKFLKTLQHRHVVHYYGGGIHQGQPFVAMELLKARSLASVLASAGKLPWVTVVDYVLQICEALEYANHRGVFHLGLAPDKILITEQGEVKIVGFRYSPSGPRAAEKTLEKAAYLAPEQICGKPPVSHKTDLYALGCVMFEMLTGRPPFVAPTLAERLKQHLADVPPRVSAADFDCPIWLDALVAQLLEKQPDKRPHFASAVAVALRETREKMTEGTGAAAHALAGKPTAIRLPSDKSAGAPLVRTKKKQREWVPFYERTWFLASCMLLVIAVVTWSLWPASEEELFAEAQKLMASSSRSDWNDARRWYLEPLLERFPKGKYAAQAQAYIDLIDMEKAEARMLTNLRLGRPPKSEGERLYGDARRYEQFGDRVTAVEKYRAMLAILPAEGEDLPFVKLAGRQIKQLQQEIEAGEDRVALIEGRLNEADRLAAEGRHAEAREIWQSVVALYRGNKELVGLVERAEEGLSGKRDSETGAEDQDAKEVPAGEPTGGEENPPDEPRSSPAAEASQPNP